MKMYSNPLAPRRYSNAVVRHDLNIADAVQFFSFHIAADNIAELFSAFTAQPRAAGGVSGQQKFFFINMINRLIAAGTLDLSVLIAPDDDDFVFADDPFQVVGI